MTASTRSRTFRVRRLPNNVNTTSTAGLLATLEPKLGPVGNIRILSLAHTINPRERPPTKTATIMFREHPAILSEQETDWVLKARDMLGYPNDIIIDSHFRDFTPLNDVSADDHKADCIAISGLGSHPLGSWKCKTQDDYLWLRDQLPLDVPGARAVLYGYDTQLIESSSFQDIQDLARMLVFKLRSNCLVSSSARSIVFFAHSLGGILLKQALLFLASGDEAGKIILKSIKGVVFFGVPNKGMHITHLLSMVKGKPNKALVECLSQDSAYLEQLEKQYAGISTLRYIRLISIYETKQSRTTKSAIHAGSTAGDILPIDQDHSSLVKFSYADENYDNIIVYLKEIIESPHQNLFQTEKPLDSHGAHMSGTSQRLVDIDSTYTKSQKALVDDDSRIPINTPGYWSNPHPSLLKYKEWVEEVKELEGFGRYQQYKHGEDRRWNDYVQHMRELMMDSLKLEDADWRYRGIEDALPSTFKWVFEDESLGLVEWFEQSTGLFWINGKPGSGKSTLMKRILQDPKIKTQSSVARQRKDEVKITVSYFFHDRGTYSQKSFEGLLQNIIHQILANEPKLQVCVEEIFVRNGFPAKPLWDLDLLELAFRSILQQDILKLKVLLFLDALDEYDGPPELICEFLTNVRDLSITSKTKIGVCFASRPWEIFHKIFSSCPSLTIHEHNSEDIRVFAKEKLGWKRSIHELLLSLDEDSNLGSYSKVLEYIVARAQGVFVWVILTVGELLRLSQTDSCAADVSKALEALPDELETFYERILDRIPARYRIESYILLEIILRSENQLLNPNGIAFAMACAKLDNFATCRIQFELMSTHSEHSLSLAIIRRHGWALLDATYLENEEHDDRMIVGIQFMHQTVKDYLQRPGSLSRLLDVSVASQIGNGCSILSKSLLTICVMSEKVSSIKSLWNGTWLQLVENCFHYAHEAETTTGLSQRIFFDSIRGQKSRQWFWRVVDIKKDHTTYRPDGEKDNFLGKGNERIVGIPCERSVTFAAMANLQLYMREKLPRLRNKTKSIHMELLGSIIQATESGSSEMPQLGIRKMIAFLADDSDEPITYRHHYSPSAYWNSDILVGLAQGSDLLPSHAEVLDAIMATGWNPNKAIQVMKALKATLLSTNPSMLTQMEEAKWANVLTNPNTVSDDDSSDSDTLFTDEPGGNDSSDRPSQEIVGHTEETSQFAIDL
ncbi:hypothetical protein FH972_025507 [Carpinus fangiana]|uniref:Nephrocystin 3-like N-terminal domain-containing protein n=1 Tax=Carpinus fangiana TaxID=176857 RepID=A0A5N6L184_9ROSI|nr:hypothetical protein FH972_025507 [Carpinus fangiana]